MLKILIVEDNLEFANNLFNYIKNKDNEEYVITNIITDGEEAYEYLTNHFPDVMILDLQIPKLNGKDLILKLSENKKVPKIIISTGDTDLLLQIVKLNVKIEYVCVKPYDYAKLYEQLVQINMQLREDDIEIQINNLLSEFYFNKVSVGYKYIVECIKECINQNTLLVPFETNLYSVISQKNNVKSKYHVKWSIDKSINSMKKYTHKDILNKYFPNEDITSKIFINKIYTYICHKLGKK